SVFVEIRKRLPDETKSSELCSLTGKVLEAENLTDSEMRVVVNVVQVDELSWNALLNIFDSRQAQISEFLNAVRG
ncbi:MAG TPA: hypothetical protein PLH57_11480, partial [Oligoflexia bacterium]|nr:hypothetical protein [Oligoflexia bacterium]